MKFWSLLFLFSISIAAQAQEISDKNFALFYKQDIAKSKGILVVNFWATWCKPCVEELPYFERIFQEMKSDSFNVCLANLDFNSKYKSSATDFVNKKSIQSKVVHINDSDPNEWINKVDLTWSGAIPATVIFLNGSKVFFKEGEMTYEEISSVISKIKN